MSSYELAEGTKSWCCGTPVAFRGSNDVGLCTGCGGFADEWEEEE